MFLDLARVKRVALRVDAGGDHIKPLVHVRKQERGADTRLRVETRASVAVSARADLEVKRTVYPVFLGPENRRQVLRHRRLRNIISPNSQIRRRFFYVGVWGNVVRRREQWLWLLRPEEESALRFVMFV